MSFQLNSTPCVNFRSENGYIFSSSGLKTGMNFRGQVGKRVWKMACLGLK